MVFSRNDDRVFLPGLDLSFAGTAPDPQPAVTINGRIEALEWTAYWKLFFVCYTSEFFSIDFLLHSSDDNVFGLYEFLDGACLWAVMPSPTFAACDSLVKGMSNVYEVG